MKTKKRSRSAALLIPMLLLAVSVLFAVSAGAQTLTAVAPIGDGSVDDPYWIETPENLMWMSEQAKSGNLCVDGNSKASTCSCGSCDENHTHYFKLMNDLDFSGYEGFTAIAQSQFRDYSFHGTFDGNGHTIRGLRINKWSRYNGVFGTVWDTVIRDVTFEDVELSWTADFSAIAVGYAEDSEISDVTVTGCRISAEQSFSGAFADRVGMICGFGGNTGIIDCTVIDPSISSAGMAGAVCGQLEGGRISGVSVEGVDPYQNDLGYGAGIVSLLDGGTVENCTVCADLGLCTAGIVRGAEGGGLPITISGCRVYKRTEDSLQTIDFTYGGGIVGFANSYIWDRTTILIENCVSELDIAVTACDELSIGGIAGAVAGEVRIVDCYAEMTIREKNGSELSDAAIGGIVGELYDGYPIITIENCVSKCTLPAARYVGGLIGGDDSYVEEPAKVTFQSCVAEAVLPDVTGLDFVEGCGTVAGMIAEEKNISERGGVNDSGTQRVPFGIRTDPWLVGSSTGYDPADIIAYTVRDTLYIEGSAGGQGMLASYADPADVPWNGIAGQIKKVVLLGYIRNIGKNTFAALGELDSVTIAGNTVIPKISASDLPRLAPDGKGKLYVPAELEWDYQQTYEAWWDIRDALEPITVTRMSLGREEIRVAPGQTVQAKAVYEPQYASCGLSWSSSDESVFIVDADGTVTGVAEGTATLTAVTEDGSITSSCPVSVGCEEVTDGSLAFCAASLTLENCLTLTYKVKVGEGYENPRLNYRIRNAATGQDDVGTAESYVEVDGELLFEIPSIAPQRAGDNIRAELVAVRDGVPYRAVKDDYSILNYLSALTEYDSDAEDYDAALQLLIGDLIVYCSEVQKYSGYDPDHLIEDRVTPAVRSAAPAGITAGNPVEKMSLGSENWAAQTMVLSDSIAFIARFEAENIDGLCVKAELNGRRQDFSGEELEYDEKTKRYSVIYEGVCASEFDDKILFTITTTEGGYNRAILSTSVNAYIKNKLKAGEPKATDGVLAALYNYGVSAAAYADGQGN